MSQQRNNRQPKKNGGAPAPASSGKSRSSRRRKNKNAGSSMMYSYKTISAPLSQGVVRQYGTALRFGAAAPHDDYPEGGLRISGRNPAYYQIYVADATLLGGWSPSHYDYCSCSPVGNRLGVTGNQVNMFDGSNTLVSLINSFESYRIRKLCFDYAPLIGTNTVGGTNLQNTLRVTYFRDPCDDTVSTTATHYTNGQTVEWPLWEPLRTFLIDEKSSSRADKLYRQSSINDISNDFGWAQNTIQGVCAVTSSLYGTASNDVAVGSVQWEFVIDVYGFRSYWPSENAFSRRDQGVRNVEAKVPQPLATDDDFVPVDKARVTPRRELSLGPLACENRSMRAGQVATSAMVPPKAK